MTSKLSDLEAEYARLKTEADGYDRRKADLEAQLAALDASNLEAEQRNNALAGSLREARDTLVGLKDHIDRLAQPPCGYGVLIEYLSDGTADIFTAGRKLRVEVHPEVDRNTIEPGDEVRLSEAMIILGPSKVRSAGVVVTVRELLPDHMALVITNHDEELVVRLGAGLRNRKPRLKAGDSVLLEPSQFINEVVPKSEVEELVLEAVPDINYTDIGGLAKQIEAIQDAIELPFLHPEEYRRHQLKPPKGVLLYGPPGCGKTLIAKAVANSLAKRAKRRGKGSGTAYFLNIKGPELLNKYVGETERHIRLLFQRARDKASDGSPVIIFFDEMESLFGTRGAGISSDVQTTIVPQLLSEMDGVERLSNVIVIGASNREDRIDPAILRPGRLDIKIKVDRPDSESAVDIFGIYLKATLPIHPQELQRHGNAANAVRAMIMATVTRLYAQSAENRFLEVTYANGDKEILYISDFNSGAMVENIVARAKKDAIKQYLSSGVKGITVDHMLTAVVDEFRENQDLPNTTNPDDWAKISGRKGERIVYIRTLAAAPRPGSHNVETAKGFGTYL